MPRVACMLVLATLAAGPAAANDSIATLGAGGLELVNSDTIVMAKEDLYISAEVVKVDYVFQNRSEEAKRHVVAFPMPLIEPGFYNEGDIALADREADNFLNFKVTVDGKAVVPELELRALSGALDVTDRLTAAGLPLNPLQHRTDAAVRALPPETAAQLIELGAIGDYEGTYFPRWTLKATYYWYQDFPAGEDLQVSHSYAPGAGAWFYYPEMLDDPQIVGKYCIDDGTRRAIKHGTRDGRDMVLVHDIRYILSTGANWARTIETFRLVVDKLNPDAIVSFCMDGVRKISSTQFEVRRQDFNPTRDLDIMVVSPGSSD